MRYLLIIALLFPQLALGCGPMPDRRAQETALKTTLQNAETYRAGQWAVADLWMHYRTAPDAKAQQLLDSGLERIRLSDYANAKHAFDALISYCPAYPEAYNQRAFVYFLQGKLDKSLADIAITLDFQPDHFGALAGKAMIYQRQNLDVLSQVFLQKAVDANPWLNERHLLKPQNADDL